MLQTDKVEKTPTNQPTRQKDVYKSLCILKQKQMSKSRTQEKKTKLCFQFEVLDDIFSFSFFFSLIFFLSKQKSSIFHIATFFIHHSQWYLHIPHIYIYIYNLFIFPCIATILVISFVFGFSFGNANFKDLTYHAHHWTLFIYLFFKFQMLFPWLVSHEGFSIKMATGF